MCAPSTLSVCPTGATKALLLDCTRSELGRDTEAAAWEPSLSSGSHSSCCMRLMPSWDTRGLEGNLRDCFQLRIFCRVTCLWERGVGLNVRNVGDGTDRAADKGGIPGGPGISWRVASKGDVGSHPYKHSKIMTPRDHQSHEKVYPWPRITSGDTEEQVIRLGGGPL